jgi:hypothetical protein
MRSLLALMVAMALMSTTIGCHHTGDVYESESCDCAPGASVGSPEGIAAPLPSTGTMTPSGTSGTPQSLNEMPKMQEPPVKAF